MASHRMRMALTAALLGAAAAVQPAPAQDTPYTVRGTVVDASTRQPLPGATVTLRNTDLRAVTNAAGAYTLTVPMRPGTYTLSVTLLGRAAATRTLTLAAARTVEVEPIGLAERVLELEGLVVTGTGAPVERRQLGNTVSTVHGDAVNQSPAALSVDRALQGKIAGAVISQNSGSPGAGSTIRLRGTSSILGGADPLIVIDGVIVENNSDPLISLGSNASRQGSAIANRLSDIAPGDIERVEVLKGAAAAALYGSRANNGVIQIFTRRGAQGEPRIRFSTEATASRTPSQFYFLATPRAGLGDVTYLRKPDGTAYTLGEAIQRFNVQDEIFRTGYGTSNQLSISGGAGGTSYYVSGAWADQAGIIRATGHDKRTVRGTLTQRISDLLSVSASGSYIRSHTQFQQEGEQTTGALTIALFTPTGFDYSFSPAQGRFPLTPILGANPLQVLQDVVADADVDRFLGSAQATLTPFDGFTLTGLIGVDDSRETNVFLVPAFSITPTSTGSITNPVRSVNRWNSDVTANLETPLSARLGLTSTAGFRYTSDRTNTIRAAAENLPPGQVTVGGATQFASQGIVEVRTVGGFLQERLSLDDRLFLTGAVNVEASSAFGREERWQLFPRVGASWVVHEMPFWAGSAPAGVVSTLRLRGSYGETGGQPPAAYAIFNNFVNVGFGGRPGQVGSTVLANPDLRPERQREWEAGFETGLLRDRAQVEFTYYNQRTRDLVLLAPLHPSSGFAVQYQNIGEISNRGVEVALGADLLQGSRLGWNSRVTYATNRNRVERMRTPADTIFSEYLNIVAEGLPVGVFYGAVHPRDAQGNIVLADGRPRRLREDGTIVRRVIGDPNPDFTAAWNNDFRIGEHVRLSFLLDGRFGNDVANFTRRIQDFFGLGPMTEREIVDDDIPAGYGTLNGERHLLYEDFVEDGSFVKLREIALGYDVGSGFARRMGASGMQVRVAGRNLHTWTRYSGVDPEVNVFGGSTIARGVDFVTTPIPRTFSVGLVMNF
jgi:TonB-dependent starch-binding outer membrane protein SusC